VADGRKSVLVVDDDARMLHSLEVLLDNLGFSTELYASAEAFFSESTFRKIDNCCVILDIQLRGMSGIELQSRLMTAGYTPPIIFITGNDNETVRKAASQQGCIAYLLKPFTAKVLIDAIDKALA
jgi:FixJ family two-component response regulator